MARIAHIAQLEDGDRDVIRDLSRTHHVVSIHQFCLDSADMFEPGESEIGFVVSFEEIEDHRAYADNYHGLRRALSSALEHPVSLIVDRAIDSAELRAVIMGTCGDAIYATT